jgi:hypothetical protein
VILQAPVRVAERDLPVGAERVQIHREAANPPHDRVVTVTIQNQEDLQNSPTKEERPQKIFQNLRVEGSHLAGEKSHQDFRHAVKDMLAGQVDHTHVHAMTVTTLHPDGLLNFQAKEEKGRNLYAEANRLAEETCLPDRQVNPLDFLPEAINRPAGQAGPLPVQEMIVETQDQHVHQNSLVEKATQKSFQSLVKGNLTTVRRNVRKDFQNLQVKESHLTGRISQRIRKVFFPS